ncbi:MAG: hypothetical protein NTW21_01290 [Verrucomicrobia bacterium]|nr:hypothetical protein [Verrucomicrobiota bacterium]
METEAANVAAVVGHVVNREGGTHPAAAQVAAAPLADESDPPARHEAGVEVVPGPVAELAQVSASTDPANLAMVPELAPQGFNTWPNAQVCCAGVEAGEAAAGPTAPPVSIRLVPFANAGATGTAFKVGLPLSAEKATTGEKPQGLRQAGEKFMTDENMNET